RTASAPALGISLVREILAIRRRGIDTCVDLEFFARATALIAFLTGARSRVGLHAFAGAGPYRGDLFTHRVLYNPHLHTSAMFATLMSALAIDPRLLPTHPIALPAGTTPPRF